MTTRKSWMSAGATWIAMTFVASAALTAPALAQAASNPTDVLAPAEPETFTFTFRSTVAPLSDAWSFNTTTPSLELPSVGKWRFTLDIDDHGEERLELDNLKAGAFFDITPRMRLGGALSFSGDDSAISRATGGLVDEDVPEVKFESAFKF